MRRALVVVALLSLPLLVGCKKDPPASKRAASPDAVPAQPSVVPEARVVALSPNNGTVGFHAAKVTGSHEGTFKDFSGKVQLVGTAIEKSQVEVTIVVTSLEVEPAKLKEHLLSADFLDQKKFDSAKFVSTTIVPAGRPGTFTITGTLTLHGRTKTISSPISIELRDGHLKVDGEIVINRQDFDIVYPGAPDDLISDDVRIKVHFDSVVPDSAAPAPK